MNEELLEFCMKKGFLLDKEIFELFNKIEDIEFTKLIIERISKTTGQRIITKIFLIKIKIMLKKFFLNFHQ